jgi:hypothetical protein
MKVEGEAEAGAEVSGARDGQGAVSKEVRVGGGANRSRILGIAPGDIVGRAPPPPQLSPLKYWTARKPTFESMIAAENELGYCGCNG